MANDNNVVTFQQRQREQAEALDQSRQRFGGGGSSGTSGGDGEKLARLEGIVEGLRTNHTLLMSCIGLVSALLLALGSYTLVKLDQLSSRVGELPSRITTDIQALTSTLSQSITAAKQPQPQVILIPPPPSSPTGSPTKP